MEQSIESTGLDASAIPGKVQQPEQPGLSPAAPAFLPIRISDSGKLVLDPGQSEEAYMERLQKLMHSKETLQKAGYVMQPLTELELDQKKKCARCHKYLFKKAAKHTLDGELKPGSDAFAASSANKGSADGKTDVVGNAAKGSGRSNKPPANGPKKDCRYHKGYFNRGMWSCCKGGGWSQPCEASVEHKPAEYKPGELEQKYRYYRTPTASLGSTVRRAVAIDCEMGTGTTNESLCIRVSVVDYFTAKTLVDKLVFPDQPIQSYNTKFSGVNHKQMATAKASGDCFFGIAAAREAIWKFIGPDTIVVAHSGQNDLNSLRWLHGNIVDTQLVESLPVLRLEKEARDKELSEKPPRQKEATGEDEPRSQEATGFDQKNLTEKEPQPRDPRKATEEPKKRHRRSNRFSLKTLTKQRVGREIQMGKEGHDSVKDAVATRDVAHWNVVNLGHGVYHIKSSSS